MNLSSNYSEPRCMFDKILPKLVGNAGPLIMSLLFNIQRLKPGDPILSFHQCERHTFSMRPDREVRYCITVQQCNKGDNAVLTTGIVSQKFGLGDKTSRSEVRYFVLLSLFWLSNFQSIFSLSIQKADCNGILNLRRI